MEPPRNSSPAGTPFRNCSLARRLCKLSKELRFVLHPTCSLGASTRRVLYWLAVIHMVKILVLAMLAAVIAACCATVTSAQAPFKGPEVTAASDIQYPIQSIADGVVVLDVSLNDKVAVIGTTVGRHIPSL